LMVYICTKAAEGKFQQTHIDLEGSANAFLTCIGVSVSGQAYKAVRVQMNAIAACTMAFIQGDATDFTNDFLKPVRSVSGREGEDAADIWPSGLVLSKDFLAELDGRAVPLDYEALAKLKGSALALDAYAWLAYKLPNMAKADEYLSWESLKSQFGHEYRDVKEFAREMRGAISKALAVYPTAKAEFPRGRLRVFKAAPPVARKLHIVKAIAAPASADDNGLGCDALEMDDKLIAAFNKAAGKLPRGFDRYAVLAAYKRHMTGKPRPKNMHNDCIYWALSQHAKTR
jgi:hypothetical protein